MIGKKKERGEKKIREEEEERTPIIRKKNLSAIFLITGPKYI